MVRMAPELVEEKPYDGKVDIWGVGITCCEMADGVPPLYDPQEDPIKALYYIVAGDPPTSGGSQGMVQRI